MAFLGLYDFNGSVRRNKVADAVVDSMNDKERFLQNLREQRAKSAKAAKERTACIRMQRVWRRYRSKCAAHQVLRHDFDTAGSSIGDIRLLLLQISRLNMFYRHAFPGDDERLITLCSDALALSRLLSQNHEMIPIVKKIAMTGRITQFLSKAGRDAQFAMPLRFLQTFLSASDYALLGKKNYFVSMLNLVSLVCPESVDLSVVTIREHISGRLASICDQLIAPLLSISETSVSPNVDVVLLFECVFSHTQRNVMIGVVLPFLKRFIESKFSSAFLLSCLSGIPSASKDYLITSYALSLLVGDANAKYSDEDRAMTLHVLAAVLQLSGKKLSTGCSSDQMEVDQDPVDLFIVKAVDAMSKSAAFVELCVKCASLDVAEVKDILLLQDRLSSSDFVRNVASSGAFPNRLYRCLTSMGPDQGTHYRGTYIGELKAGHSISDDARSGVIGGLKMMCGVLITQMETFLDDDLMPDGKAANQIPQIIEIARMLRDLSMGLIDLAFPEDFWSSTQIREQRKKESAEWSSTYERIVHALQAVFRKNTRVNFLPSNFWTDHNRPVVVSRTPWASHNDRYGRRRPGRGPFTFVRYLRNTGTGPKAADADSDDDIDMDPNEAQPSVVEMRNLNIIRSIPFVVPFTQRLKIFQELLQHDKAMMNSRDGMVNMARFEEDLLMGRRGAGIHLSVRRESLYEDAFESLSPGNAPNLRLGIRVSMINWAGMNEIGQDGGGIFREFLSELLKTGFDANRGFFTLTHDRLMYPNPTSAKLHPDSYSQHYYFLGRMVAKLIYEGQMMDMRFADFFLVQLLGGRVTNIDLEQMKSYDPTVYRHLRALLSYSKQELESLSLDFSIIVDCLGVVETVNLKPGGRETRVTTDNRQEYVQLYVNYFLRKRLEPFIDAMRSGVSDVIDVGWLAMFDSSELQMIVSGVDADIDIDDMKRFCEVYNTKNEGDQLYMTDFWRVCRELSREDKANLLKFITGCSRPPIEGFRLLNPPMGIQVMHDSDDSILPMSATCMNLFKLPRYKNIETLRSKLLYAIRAGAGFELM